MDNAQMKREQFKKKLMAIIKGFAIELETQGKLSGLKSVHVHEGDENHDKHIKVQIIAGSGWTSALIMQLEFKYDESEVHAPEWNPIPPVFGPSKYVKKGILTQVIEKRFQEPMKDLFMNQRKHKPVNYFQLSRAA